MEINTFPKEFILFSSKPLLNFQEKKISIGNNEMQHQSNNSSFQTKKTNKQTKQTIKQLNKQTHTKKSSHSSNIIDNNEPNQLYIDTFSKESELLELISNVCGDFFISPLLFYHILVYSIQKYSNGHLFRSILFQRGTSLKEENNQENSIKDSNSIQIDLSDQLCNWRIIEKEFNEIMLLLSDQTSTSEIQYVWKGIKEHEMRTLYYRLISNFPEDQLLQIIVDLRIQLLENLKERVEILLMQYESNNSKFINSSNSSNNNNNNNNNESISQEGMDLQTSTHSKFIENSNTKLKGIGPILSFLNRESELDLNHLQQFQAFENTLNSNLENVEEIWTLEQEKHVNRILDLHQEVSQWPSNTRIVKLNLD